MDTVFSNSWYFTIEDEDTIDPKDRIWTEWTDALPLAFFEAEEVEEKVVLSAENNLQTIAWKPGSNSFWDLPGEMRNAVYEQWLIAQARPYTQRHRGLYLVHPNQIQAVEEFAHRQPGRLAEELRSYFFYSRRVGRYIPEAIWAVDLIDLWKLQSDMLPRGGIFNAFINREIEVAHTGAIGLCGVQQFLDDITQGKVLAPKSAFRGKRRVNVRMEPNREDTLSITSSLGLILANIRFPEIPGTTATRYSIYTKDGIKVWWWECPHVKDRMWVWAFATESRASRVKLRRFEVSEAAQRDRMAYCDRENFEKHVSIWPWQIFYKKDGRRMDFLIPAAEKSDQ